MQRIISAIFLLTWVDLVAAQCTFPTDFQDVWVTSTDGTWTVTSTLLQNYDVTGLTAGTPPSFFECQENQGTQYVLKSEAYEIFAGFTGSVYTCIDLQQQTASKYIYYKATAPDPSGLRFTINTAFADICNEPNHVQPYSYHMALKNGTETTALVTCPASLFGTYTYDTCTDGSSTGTSMDVCATREQLIFDYTLCNTHQMFSQEGVLDCVYFASSGSVSYLTVYNRDTTAPDGTTYYLFSCLVVEETGSTVSVTVRPNECASNQTSTGVDGTGQALQLTPIVLCPITTTTQSTAATAAPEATDTSWAIYVGAAIGGLIALAAIVGLIICCCLLKRRKRRKVDEERPIAEDSDDQSIKSGSSKNSETSNDDTKSTDSGISEPPTTGRSGYKKIEEDGEQEVVIVAIGERDFDNKGSRPQSGQPLSRMSDLPPSTVPPGETPVNDGEDQGKDDTEQEQGPCGESVIVLKDESLGNKDKESKSDQDVQGEDDSGKDNEPENDSSTDIDKEPKINQEINAEQSGEKENRDVNPGVAQSEDGKELDDSTDSKKEENDSTDSETDTDQSKSDKDTNGSCTAVAPMHEQETQEERTDQDSDADSKPDDDKYSEKQGQHSDENLGDTKSTAETRDSIGTLEDRSNTGSSSKKSVIEGEGLDETKDEDKSGDEEVNRQSDKQESEDEDKDEEEKGGEEEEEEGEKKGDKREDGEEASEEDGPHRKRMPGGESGSEDGEDRDYTTIGGKKKKGFTPAGPLTTVLISREDEERKRQKVKGKNKKQRMKRLAKIKTRRFGPDGEEGEEEDFYSSDDEKRKGINRDAPFLKQYHHKKRIEHKLDEEHYWSDPEEERDPYGLNEEFDSIFSSDASSRENSDTEDDSDRERGDSETKVGLAGQNDREVGSPMDADEDKKEGTNDARKKRGSRDATKGSEDEDSDSRGSTEDKKAKDGSASPEDTDISDEKRRIKDLELIQKGQDGDMKDTTDTKEKRKGKKTTFINVKEHDGKGKDKGHVSSDDLDTFDNKKGHKGQRRLYGRRGSDGMSVDIGSSGEEDDKVSDIDSGVEEEEVLDVILTPEQRQILINSLFDDDGNLRPEFDTDEEGRIIRRLDNSIIYDPHTGRFTFRKRLGRLFNVPRLKRSKSGRPTGGYIEDDYGPSISTDLRGDGKENAQTDSEHPESIYGQDEEMRRPRGDNKSVGFLVADDDDFDAIAGDQNEEFKRRGRRDIGSAIRRKLRSRLFRKKRKRRDPNGLPDLQVKRAWDMSGSMNQNLLPDSDGREGHHADYLSPHSHPGLNPVHIRRGRPGPPFGSNLTPSSQRRPLGMTPEQLQLYRDGLQSDKRILENLQNKEGGKTRPFEPREAFVELEGESSTDPPEPRFDEDGNRIDDGRPGFRRGNTYWTDDGRFVIRERGCPELKQDNRLFTIIRRPGDLEREHQERQQQLSNDQNRQAPLSAPMMLEDINKRELGREREVNQGSQNSLFYRSSTGSNLIDDNRLRRLLEELYKDKKYFDSYVTKQEPKSEATILSTGLAEHGRDYLLERADYWEQRGPLPPRPPQTAVGWKMYRQQTMWASARTSDMGSSTETFTITPDPRPYTVPGVVESPPDSSV